MEPVVEAPAVEAGRPIEGEPIVEAATMSDSGIDTGVLVEAPAMPDSGSVVGQDGSRSQGPSPRSSAFGISVRISVGRRRSPQNPSVTAGVRTGTGERGPGRGIG